MENPPVNFTGQAKKKNHNLAMFNPIVFLFEGTTHFSYEIRYT